MGKFFIVILLVLAPWNCAMFFGALEFRLRGEIAAFPVIAVVTVGCLAYVHNPKVGILARGATWLLAIDAIVFEMSAAWILPDLFFGILRRFAPELETDSYGWGCLGVLLVTGLIALAGLGPLAVLTCVIDRWRRPTAGPAVERQSAEPLS